MKKTIFIFFISIFSFSCKKDKQASVVGVWKEVAIYFKDNTGNYKWEQVLHGFPYFLTLRDDGTYSGWQCTPTGRGVYQYDHANKQIKMQDIPSGSTETVSVSALDDNYLIIDYSANGVVVFRRKFLRNRY